MRMVRGRRLVTRKLIKPILRPFYRMTQRLLIRMITPSDLPIYQGAYQFRGLFTHPARQHPLLFDPARCLLPFTAEELTPASRDAARNRLGIPSDQHVIVSLGMINHDKGAMPCLNALEQLHYWNVPSHLYLLGPIQNGMFDHVHDTIARLGLTESVHIWDQVSDPEIYRDLLIAGDCAIQIQTHMPGAFSGALLDCLSAGLPTICNTHLGTIMNAPSFVKTVPDELSPLLIAEQLLELYQVWESHRQDDQFRALNSAEHYATNYSPQILKLLLAA